MTKSPLVIGIAKCDNQKSTFDAALNEHLNIIDAAHQLGVQYLVFPFNSLTDDSNSLCLNKDAPFFDEIAAAAGHMAVSLGFREQITYDEKADMFQGFGNLPAENYAVLPIRTKRFSVSSQVIIRNGNVVHLQRYLTELPVSAVEQFGKIEQHANVSGWALQSLIGEDFLNPAYVHIAANRRPDLMIVSVENQCQIALASALDMTEKNYGMSVVVVGEDFSMHTELETESGKLTVVPVTTKRQANQSRVAIAV
ncbi:hypothetical protein [Veronia pacifica]|uniref:hypothetical protein n=1 Tax=Veronia pacifica TaxID=1080227 RepID=UPI001112FCDE|nr:hypothetical protein [Veronia pacifica]